MKKNIFYLMLVSLTLFTFINITNISAQVIIGKDTIPHLGAVLELRADKGLLLPRVNLVKTDSFQLSDKASEVAGMGMIVYNTNHNIADGKGEGVYAWNGKSWIQMIMTEKNIPVTKITITADTTAIPVKGTLQFKSEVEPDNASNKTIVWSVVSGTGFISDTGLFTAGTDNGKVIIKAEAVDGSHHSDEKTIMIISVTGLHKENGYNVYTFASNTNLGTWMVEHSKEERAGETITKKDGIYYYSQKQASKFACPDEYRLPTEGEWTSLKNYINNSATPYNERGYWTVGSALAGYCYNSGTTLEFRQFGQYGYWWTSTQEQSFYVYQGEMKDFFKFPSAYSIPVRCIKK